MTPSGPSSGPCHACCHWVLAYIWTLFSAVVTSQFSSEQLSVLYSHLRAHPGRTTFGNIGEKISKISIKIIWYRSIWSGWMQRTQACDSRKKKHWWIKIGILSFNDYWIYLYILPREKGSRQSTATMYLSSLS